MKNKWRILKILVTVVLLGFLLSFSLKRFSEKKFEENEIKVKLLNSNPQVYFMDEKTIVEMVKKENPTRKIGDVDVPNLESELNKIPSVDSANVFLNLNGELNVDILQKVPAFRLLKEGKDFYVDADGNEFPISRNYSHPSMLVMGNVEKKEYKKVAELVKKINDDDFCRKYFIGITKAGRNYNLLTSEGNFKVEIGGLDDIDFKVKGFKTFVEKFLVYQNPEKYSKISVKFDNQIVTTLNPSFAENDSILQVRKKQLEKIPEVAQKKAEAEKKLKESLEKKKK